MSSRAFSLAKIIRSGSNVAGGSTAANVPNSIVTRDNSGNFSAGTITSSLSGNASTATTLQTARTIAVSGDVTGSATSFNGSANITISSSITSGSIVNDDINASAAIADTKLATISTAGKVSNSATTATNANTANAIVARDASGNFTAGVISADQFNSTNNANGTNYKVGDDAWIGDVNQANTIRITGQQDSSKGYIIFGNSNSTALGRSGTGDLTYGGVFSATEFTSTNASGDEGGQLNLAKPPNATTSGGVTIDAYQNRLRIFENGGSARGVYIDLTAAAGNAGTNLLASTVNDGTLTLAVSGTGLSGSATFTANQSASSTFTVTSNATDANTASAIVARDASGNFSAGTITAALSGNATTASTLQTARTIAISGDITGSATSFNGGSNITISAGITAGSIVSSDFSSAASLIIYNSAGTALKTIYSPGS